MSGTSQADGCLATGWERARVGDLCDAIRQKGAKGSVPYLEIGNIDTTRKEYSPGTKPAVAGAMLARRGDVLVSRVRPSRGAVVVITEPEIHVSSALTVLRPKGGLEPEVIHSALAWNSDFFEHLKEQSTGTLYPTVKQDVILNYEVLVPPAGVRKRLTSAIDSCFTRLDAAVATLEQVQRNLKQYRASVLKAAVEGKLVPTVAELAGAESRRCESMEDVLRGAPPRLKVRRGVPETVAPGPSASNACVPGGWIFSSVSELLRRGILLDVKDGNHGANHPKRSEFTPEGVPFITAAQVVWPSIDYAGAPKLSGAPLERLRVGFAEPGDVILTHKGSVGRVAVADRSCVLTPQTTYYRPNTSYIDAQYLALHHASPAFGGQLHEMKSQTTRDFVPIRDQYRLFVLLPPIAEQQRIVQVAEELLALGEFVRRQCAESLQRIALLRRAAIKWAFEGLLVDEDPSGESASILLDRIRAEREASESKSPKRRSTRKGRKTPA